MIHNIKIKKENVYWTIFAQFCGLNTVWGNAMFECWLSLSVVCTMVMSPITQSWDECRLHSCDVTHRPVLRWVSSAQLWCHPSPSLEMSVVCTVVMSAIPQSWDECRLHSCDVTHHPVLKWVSSAQLWCHPSPSLELSVVCSVVMSPIAQSWDECRLHSCDVTHHPV